MSPESCPQGACWRGDRNVLVLVQQHQREPMVSPIASVGLKQEGVFPCPVSRTALRCPSQIETTSGSSDIKDVAGDFLDIRSHQHPDRTSCRSPRKEVVHFAFISKLVSTDALQLTSEDISACHRKSERLSQHFRALVTKNQSACPNNSERLSQKVRALVPTIQSACHRKSERLYQQFRALVPSIFVGTAAYICWDKRLYLLGQA